MTATTLRGIFTATAAKYGLTLSEIRSPDRSHHIARPRHEGMLIAYRAGYSLHMIGIYLHRNHTTILHGVRVAEEREAAGFIIKRKRRPKT